MSTAMNPSWQDRSERPLSISSRSLSFYVVFLGIVLPFWLLVPLSWVFVLYSLCSGNYWFYGSGRRAILSIASCEVTL
jgi:hypothetical protein